MWSSSNSLRSVSTTASVLEADSKLLEGCPNSISLPESLDTIVALVATEEGDSSGVSLSEKTPPLPLDFLGFFSADPYIVFSSPVPVVVLIMDAKSTMRVFKVHICTNIDQAIDLS